MRFSVCSRALCLLALLLGGVAAPAHAQAWHAPEHKGAWPALVSGESPRDVRESLAQGPELERNRPAKEMLADSRRLATALAAIQPHVVDVENVVAQRIPAQTEALRLLRHYLAIFRDRTSPTSSEVMRYEASGWQGIGAPKNAPAEMINDPGGRGGWSNGTHAPYLGQALLSHRLGWR